MPQGVKYGFYVDANQAIGQINKMNAACGSATKQVDTMNTVSTKGFMASSSAVNSLALRFVGYNLVLNTLMGAQQKLIKYVTESVDKFREFQTRIAEVSTIMTGDYEPALTGMKAGIESLALATGQATSDLTKGLYDIMSAAFSAKDAMNLLNTATKASIAGLSDVRTSVDIFTTVLNAYGMSAYEATHVSDVLFQSVVRGKFQFADLESALGYVVPIAAQAGIKFDELMAALSTTTRHGLHLDMASRGLAMALQNIINPSEGAAKAAKKYGIELSGLALRIKGISGVFGEMQEKTREYGKIVLNELIPNIRSLRVAMVLAGEEGLEGMLDDMDRLSVVAGRTEEAFQKIANTSQFASNQITQQWEQTQREVGEDFDKLVLAGQSWITGLAKIMSKPISWVPIIGPMLGATQQLVEDADTLTYKYKMMEKYLHKYPIPQPDQPIVGASEWAREKRKQYPGAKEINLSDQRTSVTIMKDYLDLQKKITDKATELNEAWLRGQDNVDKLNGNLQVLTTISATLQEDFNRAFGEPVLTGIRNLEDLNLLLDEIEFNIIELEEHLKKPLTYGWGEMGGVIEGTLNMQMAQLKAEQDLADTKYDVKMGLIDENYQYKVLNQEMQNAIAIVREHDAATKADTETINLMNVALRKIQIEMLELQLVGMMRRRGLSRQEERRMKKLEIAAAKLRLENMKNTKAETASQYIAYEQAKELIEKHIAAKEHESYMLKYNYDQQLEDLQLTIDYEAEMLKEREKNWEETSNNIIDESGKILRFLTQLTPQMKAALEENLEFNADEVIQNLKTTASEEIYKNTGMNLETMLAAAKTPVESYGIFKRMRGYQRGTEYVPETGLALIHRGERIGAAGKEEHSGTQIGTVIIQVKELADIGSPEKLAALLSVAKDSQILSKTGKTHYRLR